VLPPTRTTPPGMQCESHKLLCSEIGPPQPGTAHLVSPSIDIAFSIRAKHFTLMSAQLRQVSLPPCFSPASRAQFQTSLRRMAMKTGGNLAGKCGNCLEGFQMDVRTE
jgi:hypothetical protein